MTTAERQDGFIGYTRKGTPVFEIRGAQDPAPADPPAGDPPKGDPPAGDPPEFKPVGTQADLDRIVQNRLTREREKYADYAEHKKKAEEFDKLQESQKTELQKAADRASAAETKAQASEIKALRLEVAADKGLSPAQAKRLVGATKEELESDADELLAEFKPAEGGGAPPKRKPNERLRGGADPTDEPEETDPRKLAEKIPRL